LAKRVNKKAAIAELWKRGDLSYLLHDTQKEVKKTLLTSSGRISTLLMARRSGKSYLLITMSIEECLKKPRATVKYTAPTQAQAKEITTQIMPEILKDCPKELTPVWYENDKQYVFPNGSRIQLRGVDNKRHEGLRGGSSDMCIVDEAGFTDELDYIVKSILRPTVLTTGGRIFLVSTPSKQAGHDFIEKYVKPAQASGQLKIYTIDDNPMLTQDVIEELKAEYPQGENDPQYLREYYCKIVFDEDTIVVPEFLQLKDEIITDDYELPPFYDAYVSGDVGFKDLTIYLFGIWDFRNHRLIVTDEFVINGAQNITTQKIADGIKQKESTNFLIGGEQVAPYMRVMDNDLIMISDLRNLHNLVFFPTAKDNKQAAVNQLRMMVAQKQIIIDPKCKNLIYHLTTATWDKNHKSFVRLPRSSDGILPSNHADGVDGLVYMVRNINMNKNPYPSDYGELKGSNIFRGRKKDSPLEQALKKIFNIGEN